MRPTSRRIAPPRARGVEAAKRLRKQWGNPEQPIADLFAEIESRTAIRVVRWPFSGKVDGGIFGDAGARVMLINTRDHTLGRQRATAAHELGHFEEDDGREFAESIDTSQPAEGFADGFAIELLMPEAGVRDWATSNLETEVTVGEVARAGAHFVTSFEFAVIRFKELGLLKRGRAEEFIQIGARKAAFAGGVTNWFEKAHSAVAARELPSSYVSGARGAYTSSFIKLARLAELEFDSVENVRRRLKEQGLLGEAETETEEEEVRPATARQAGEIG